MRQEKMVAHRHVHNREAWLSNGTRLLRRGRSERYVHKPQIASHSSSHFPFSTRFHPNSGSKKNPSVRSRAPTAHGSRVTCLAPQNAVSRPDKCGTRLVVGSEPPLGFELGIQQRCRRRQFAREASQRASRNAMAHRGGSCNKRSRITHLNHRVDQGVACPPCLRIL